MSFVSVKIHYELKNLQNTFTSCNFSNITKSGYCECNLLSFYLQTKRNGVKQVITLKKKRYLWMLYTSWGQFYHKNENIKI